MFSQSPSNSFIPLDLNTNQKLDTVIQKIQESSKLRFEFWPCSKIEKRDLPLQYANLAKNIPTVGREKDCKAISKRFKENFKLVFDNELNPITDFGSIKQQIQHPVITGAPGIGKSTMGNKCQEIIADCLSGLIEKPLYLRVSFSGDEADISHADEKRTGSDILGMRLLWFYLFQNKPQCWQSFQELFSPFSHLNIYQLTSVIKFIVQNHFNQTDQKKIKAVVLHIDEINVLIHRHPEKLFEIVQSIGNAFFHLAKEGIFLAIVITGTGTREQLQAAFNQELSYFEGYFHQLSLPNTEDITKRVIKEWAAKEANAGDEGKLHPFS